MAKDSGHIISKFGWETSLDDRAFATELQNRISSWSKEPLGRELNRVFDKVCPEDQIWRIDRLEIDLGEVDYQNLERELTQKLGVELMNELLRLTLDSYQREKNIQIIRKQESQLEVIGKYFAKGYFPWSYRSEFGTVDQIINHLLLSEKQQFIRLIRSLGRSEKVRKRMAWQIKDATIRKIVQGLEPNNHESIIGFSDELVKIQSGKTVVQTGASEFRKKVWWWVLNFLLTERGTLFNRISFTRSIISQMAAHYGLDFYELLDMIRKAIDEISQKMSLRSDFMDVIRAIAENDAIPVKKAGHQSVSEIHWKSFTQYLKGDDKKVRQRQMHLNELLPALVQKDERRFKQIIEADLDSKALKRLSVHLNADVAKTLVKTWLKGSSSEYIVHFESLRQQLVDSLERFDEKNFWISVLNNMLLRPNDLTSKNWIQLWAQEFEEKSKLKKGTVVQTLINNPQTSMKSSWKVNTKALYFDQLASEMGHSQLSEKLFRKILEQLIQQSGTVDITAQQSNSLEHLRKILQADAELSLTYLLNYQDKEGLRKILPQIIPDNVFHTLVKKWNDAHPLLKWFTDQLFAVADQLELPFSNQFLLNISAEIGREYIVRNEKLKFKEIQQIFLSYASKLTEEKRIYFLELAKAYFQRIGNKITLSQSQIEAFVIEFQIQQELSFETKVKFWKEQGTNTKIEFILLLKKLYYDKEFIQIRLAESPVLESLLEYLFPQLSLSKIEKLKVFWKQFTIKNSSIRNTQLIFEDVLWNILLTVGPQVTMSKLEDLFFESIINSHQINSSSQFISTTEVSPKLLKKLRKKLSEVEGTVFDYKTFRKLFKTGEKEIFFNKAVYSRIDLLKLILNEKPEVFAILFEKELSKTEQLSIVHEIGIHEILFAFQGTSNYGLWMKAAHELYFFAKELLYKDASFEQKFEDAIQQVLAKGGDVNKFLSELIEITLEELMLNSALNSEEVLTVIASQRDHFSKGLIKALKQNETVKSLFDDVIFNETEELKKNIDLLSDNEVREVWYYLIQYGQTPSWLKFNSKTSLKNWVDKLLERSVSNFLIEIRRSKNEAVKKVHFKSLISFERFVTSISKVNPTQATLMGRIQELYLAFNQISSNRLLLVSIKDLIYQKLFLSWKNNDWNFFRGDTFWKEIFWELKQLQGWSRDELLVEFAELSFALPAAYRMELERYPLPKKLIAVQEDMIEEEITEELWEEEEPEIEATGIYVKNAGLVLINNYLSMLFERCGLLVDGEFVDKQAQYKAVYYLQFVATSVIDVDEGFLALNKLLCGIHPSTPIEALEEMPEDDRDVINGMLTAMGSHWSQIGETSTMGFRGNWLVREGLLVESIDRWELNVEKRAYDVLLNQSPFSFSIIKYPWMKKPLHVNWSY
ncbi:MAG: hypothetical protein MI810_07355 [Flavobacteriales bacterium]|nr:hypothetical protein [Flavobacteriales bacterium]